MTMVTVHVVLLQLWTVDGTRGTNGRSAASPVDSVELPRDPEDAICRSPPMEADCAMEI